MTPRTVTIGDIVAAVTDAAPECLQEDWDNSGWQVLASPVDSVCRGVLVSLDVTPEVVDEAAARGCNLIVSHHPPIFKGVRNLVPDTRAKRAVIDALTRGISVYSAHTSLDNSPLSASRMMAVAIGLDDVGYFAPDGPENPVRCCAFGRYAAPVTAAEFVERVATLYGGGVRFTSGKPSGTVETVVVCGGSGGEFISRAASCGVDAIVTSDVRYHDFLDFAETILIADTGHFESEICTKSIFSAIISKKFPNFALHIAECETPPVHYMVKSK